MSRFRPMSPVVVELQFVRNAIENVSEYAQDVRVDRRLRAFVFFFQAEDGIRDVAVTGVQTCALPIFLLRHGAVAGAGVAVAEAAVLRVQHLAGLDRCGRRGERGLHLLGVSGNRGWTGGRSEERRVGKEGRLRWAACRVKENGVGSTGS